MSNVVQTFLEQNPLLANYVQLKIVNISSLAKYIKKTHVQSGSSTSATAISMAIRRYFAKLPKRELLVKIFRTLTPKLVARSNLVEYIFTNLEKNREVSQLLFKKLSNSKSFTSMVQGEREIVILTDANVDSIPEISTLAKSADHINHDLGAISIGLPIAMREVIGVYSLITSALSVAQISIHSFHTIGGEVLILVKNYDLSKSLKAIDSIFCENK